MNSFPAPATMLLAFLSLVCGLILDTVMHPRREIKRLAYLTMPAPGTWAGRRRGEGIAFMAVRELAPGPFARLESIPGATLGACLSETDSNPQLRVEAQVFVLVNDSKAADFSELTKFREINGYYQAINIPRNMGRPIRYAGSTTGPAYNEKGSPLNVSWSVRPRVMKVNAESVGQWCKGNVFKEDHAHGARNLVSSEKLLSRMK